MQHFVSLSSITATSCKKVNEDWISLSAPRPQGSEQRTWKYSVRGCAFVVVQKSFFGIQKTKVFFGKQKMLLTFSEVKWGLIKCKIVLDILEGQKRQGWGSTVGGPKAAAAAAVRKHQKQQ